MKSTNKFKTAQNFFEKEIEIPEEWRCLSLSSVCKIKKNDIVKTTLYVGLEHIGQGNNQLVGQGHIENVSSNVNTFSKNYVLYGKLRPSLNKIWLATEDGYCSTDIIPLLTKRKIIPYMLLLILSDSKFLWHAISTSAGTKMPRTNWSDIKKFQVFLPPLDEQQKIASVFSDVDVLIESTQRVIEKADMLKRGLMQELLVRGIRHEKFKKVQWLFEKDIQIPVDWDYPKFSSVATINPKTEINTKTAAYVPMDAVDTTLGTIKYMEQRSVVNNSTLSRFVEFDVLFARITPSTENGKTSLVSNFHGVGIASSELTVLRPGKSVDPMYLYYYVKSYRIRAFAISQMLGTTNRQRVPDYVFKNDLNFELPTILEQQKIASILSRVDTYIKQNQQYREKLERLKKGLMQKLLTGQIRVNV